MTKDVSDFDLYRRALSIACEHDRNRVFAALRAAEGEAAGPKKLCLECEKEKSHAAFYASRAGRPAGICKDCVSRRAAEAKRRAKRGERPPPAITLPKLSRSTATAEVLSEWLQYEPDTGRITWKKYGGQNTRLGAEVGSVNLRGYRKVIFGGLGIYCHRLAWLLHFGEWPAQVINHKNGNKLDNRISNLEDISHSENCRHAHRNGLIRLPGAKSTVKLTAQQALDIRASKEKPQVLAARYAVSGATIQDIRLGRTWKNAEHLAAGGVVLSNGKKLPPGHTTGRRV